MTSPLDYLSSSTTASRSSEGKDGGFASASALQAPLSHPSSSSSLSSSSLSSGIATTPSIYVTLKIYLFVRSFHERIRTRLRAARLRKKKESTAAAQRRLVIDGFGQEAEHRAFREIDRYLGQSKRRAGTGGSGAKTTQTGLPSERHFRHQDIASRSTEELLHAADGSVKGNKEALDAIAGNDSIFIARRSDFNIFESKSSLKELIEVLVSVEELLLRTRQRRKTQEAKATYSGNELHGHCHCAQIANTAASNTRSNVATSVNSVATTYLANLEHLLLCLKEGLLRAVIDKLVDLVRQHVVHSQRDADKHGRVWFFEYPDGQRPLSTTWPWSIRPSLAVLWGVCWMFYDFGGGESENRNQNHQPSPSTHNTSGVFDNAGNMLDEQGAVLLPNQVVEQIFRDWSSSSSSSAAPPPLMSPPTTISPGPMGYYSGTSGAFATRDEQAMESWQPASQSPGCAAPRSSHRSSRGLQPRQASGGVFAAADDEDNNDDDDDDDDAADVDAEIAADNALTSSVIGSNNSNNNHYNYSTRSSSNTQQRHQSSGNNLEAARRASASSSSPFRISPDQQPVGTGSHIDRRVPQQQPQGRIPRGSGHRFPQHQHQQYHPPHPHPHHQQQQQRSGGDSGDIGGGSGVIIAQPTAYADPTAPATTPTYSGSAASRVTPYQSASRVAGSHTDYLEAPYSYAEPKAEAEAASEEEAEKRGETSAAAARVVLPQDNWPSHTRAFVDTSSSSSSPYPPPTLLHAADAWWEQHSARLRPHRLQHQQQHQQQYHLHYPPPPQNQQHQHHHLQHQQQYASAPDAAIEFSPLLSPPPPRTRTQPTPTIIVPSDHASHLFLPLQPEDVHHSATSVSSTSSLPFPDTSYPPRYHQPRHPPQPQQQQQQQHRHPAAPLVVDTSHLSPVAPFMPSLEQQEMQTPPRSPHDQHNPMDVNGLHLARKRSHSVMSGGERATHDDLTHRRSLSMEGMEDTSPHGDDFSPRSRTLKRDDPPLNEHGKYFCNFAPECEGQVFDRKCEWNKHMDKHDRPYRCADPACAKLQGFTYSGGLLRHEREVHGKHGGPKAQLMCPYPNCKRHSGKGFTRKENLNEHVRRVHESRSQASPGGMPLKRDGPVIDAALLGPDHSETPLSRLSETLVSDDVISPALKRRRGLLPGQSDGSGGGEDIDELHQEVLRLRAENAEKDARLMHMEQKMEEADRRREEEMNQMHALHEEMRQLRQAQQLQQVLGSVTGQDPKVSV